MQSHCSGFGEQITSRIGSFPLVFRVLFSESDGGEMSIDGVHLLGIRPDWYPYILFLILEPSRDVHVIFQYGSPCAVHR